MGKKDDKTNVMRILDEKGIIYGSLSSDPAMVNTADIAAFYGLDIRKVFKTLIAVGKSNEHYAFVVPGDKELDLKKAERAAEEKSVEMIPQKELLPLTGYVHGGCSPIGMKKPLKTFIDASAEQFTEICFSGGRVGHHIQLTFSDLMKAVAPEVADITKD